MVTLSCCAFALLLEVWYAADSCVGRHCDNYSSLQPHAWLRTYPLRMPSKAVERAVVTAMLTEMRKQQVDNINSTCPMWRSC